ncbi:MAG: hypothetical protein AAFR64_08455 [Pseudomonadota bacterium]
MVFKTWLIGFAAGLWALATPANAQNPSKSETDGVARALQLGEAIYRYDQAAWHGTDAMLKAIKDPRKAGVAGWIVNEVESGHEVVFYRRVEGGYEAVWSGIYNGKKVKSKRRYGAGERALTAAEAAKAYAGKLPSGEKMQRCSDKRFNSVVMPTGKEDGSLYVYYLVPQPSHDTFPFGGHHRFEVRDGGIVARRAFTNSCLNLPIKGAEDKSGPTALTISHLLDPIPTEIHVFSTFAAQLPIYVSTTQNERLWISEISQGQPRIRLVDRGS